MIKPCIRCRNAREEAQLRNVRGDLALEGLLVSYHPEILQLSENDAIDLCFNCLRELNDGNLISDSQINKTHPGSENIPIASQSLSSHIEVPLSSSVGSTEKNASFNLETLKQHGEIEKLTKNLKVREKIRKLMAQPMPVAVKKRKLSEMLKNEQTIVSSSQGSSNSDSATVIERTPAQTNDELDTEVYDSFLKKPNKIQRSYRGDIPSSLDLQASSSESLNASKNLSLSSQSNIEPSLDNNDRNRNIFVRPQTARRRQSPPPELLYQHDSSSDSDRVRNTSLGSDNGSDRNVPKRVPLRNPSVSSSSDEEEAARRRQSAERLARRLSAERRAAEERVAARRQNDGNDHSNVAAPRRINLDLPNTNPHQKKSKITSGG